MSEKVKGLLEDLEEKGLIVDQKFRWLAESIIQTSGVARIESLIVFAKNNGISPSPRTIDLLNRADTLLASNLWLALREVELFLKSRVQSIAREEKWPSPLADGGERFKRPEWKSREGKYKWSPVEEGRFGDVGLPDSFLRTEKYSSEALKRKEDNNGNLAEAIAKTANDKQVFTWVELISKFSFNGLVQLLWALGPEHYKEVTDGFDAGMHRLEWLPAIANLKKIRNLIAHHEVLLGRAKSANGLKGSSSIRKCIEDMAQLTKDKFLESLIDTMGFLDEELIKECLLSEKEIITGSMNQYRSMNMGWKPELSEIQGVLACVWSHIIGIDKKAFNQTFKSEIDFATRNLEMIRSALISIKR